MSIEIKSLMPGRITKVFVSDGDMVKKGQSIIILEAMKMENAISAPDDGRILKILVKENDIVNSTQVLFLLKL